MSEVSSRRRRIGIAAITTTALALPLTASITYAQAEAPLPPEPPMAPQPGAAPLAPDAPLAPEAPEAPSIESIDPDEEHVMVHVDEETGERRVIRHRFSRNGTPMAEQEIEAMMERLEEEMELRQEEIEVIVERAMDQAEHAAEMSAHARETGEHARMLAARAPHVELDCEGVDESGVIERDLGNGRSALVICESIIRDSALMGMDGAVAGMRAALREIRNNRDIPAMEREEAVRELQEAIEELQRERRMMSRVEAKAQARTAAPNARAASVAWSWRGRMVSPIQVSAPMRVTVPAPAFAPTLDRDEDCEEDREIAVHAARA